MSESAKPAPRETKSGNVRRLLNRKSGADIATLQKATGWQAHSVRAVLTTLRNAGYTIDRIAAKSGGGAAVYRITDAPEDS